MDSLKKLFNKAFPVKEELPPRNKQPVGFWIRLNPIWALFENIDDFGTLGDPWWNPPVYKKMSIQWGEVKLPLIGNVTAPKVVFTPVPESVNWPRWRKFHWWKRNPFHNLCFYSVGIADHHRTVYSTAEWHSVEGFTFHITPTPTLKFPLPFLSYYGAFNAYIGWRPYGAFGVACRRRK